MRCWIDVRSDTPDYAGAVNRKLEFVVVEFLSESVQPLRQV
jgi:hypothetical protein